MKLLLIYICIVASAVVMLTGCEKDIQDTAILTEGVEVGVRLSIAPDAQHPFADPTTRSDEPDFTRVTDVWVMQFSGDNGNEGAVLVTPPRYYDDPEGEIRLLSGDNQRIVVVANTGQRFYNFAVTQGFTTYGDLKALASNATAAPVLPFSFDENTTTLPMEGNAVVNIPASGLPRIEVKMYYSVAKLTVTVKNTENSRLKINKMQLKGIPPTYDVLSGEALYATADTPAVYPAAIRTNTWVDYPQETLDLETGEYTQTWYIPRNERGMAENSEDNPHLKSLFARYMGTQIINTYIEVTATTDAGATRLYRFLAGANNYDDLNIMPGYQYKSTLTFTGQSQVGVDMRIVDYQIESSSETEVIDYVQADGRELPASNCYILNPPLTGKRIYKIPVNRADDYWTQTSEKGYQTDYNENLYRLNEAGSGFGFGTELIWQDVRDMVAPRHIVDGKLTNIPSDTWSNNSQIGVTQACGEFSYSSADESLRLQNYIEIVVPAGAKRGNFLLGIYSADLKLLRPEGMGFSWSYHFWVTDYAPDAVINPTTKVANGIMQGQPEQIPVPKGHVHRYGGTIWKTGECAKKVIMDRNVGAETAGYPRSENGSIANTATDLIGTFFYQFGRKDPFPGTQSLFDENNRPVTIQVARTLGTLNDAVKNPTTLYGNDVLLYWAYRNGTTTCYENGSLYWWQDEKTKADYSKGTYTQKSFFDPSPYGWKVPRQEVLTNLTVADNTNTGTQYRFTTFANANGIYYWPAGPVYGSVFIPTIGMVNQFNVTTNFSTYAYLWLATPSSTNGYHAYGISSSYAISSGGNRRNARPIRSIQE